MSFSRLSVFVLAALWPLHAMAQAQEPLDLYGLEIMPPAISDAYGMPLPGEDDMFGGYEEIPSIYAPPVPKQPRVRNQTPVEEETGYEDYPEPAPVGGVGKVGGGIGNVGNGGIGNVGGLGPVKTFGQ